MSDRVHRITDEIDTAALIAETLAALEQYLAAWAEFQARYPDSR